MKFFIISYVNSLERRKYVAVLFSWIQCLPTQYSYDLTVNSFGKAFAHVRNCLLMKKAHGTNRIVGEQKHRRIIYENDIKRRIHQALCKNLKICYTNLLHFSTRKHNLVSFFGCIVFWQNCIVVFYIFFFSGENARWYLFLN